MDFLRLPFLYATAAAIDKAATPPTANASAEERVPVTNPWERFMWSIELPGAGGWEACKLAAWLPAAAETALVLTKHGYYPAPLGSWLTYLVAPMGIPHGYPPCLSPMLIFGTVLAIYGIYFRCSAYRALGRHFTFHVSLKEDHSLIQEWPYSVVRHPSYTGSYIVVLGYALTMAAPDSWLRTIALPQLIRHGGIASVLMAAVFFRAAVHYVLVSKMIFDRTRSEDALLQKRFGRQWDVWATDVPYRLIPGVY